MAWAASRHIARLRGSTAANWNQEPSVDFGPHCLTCRLAPGATLPRRAGERGANRGSMRRHRPIPPQIDLDFIEAWEASSRGRSPAPSSHGTGLVGRTSGSSGRWGSENSIPVFQRRWVSHPQLSQRQYQLPRGNEDTDPEVPPLLLQRHQSPLTEIRVAQCLVGSGSVTERP